MPRTISRVFPDLENCWLPFGLSRSLQEMRKRHFLTSRLLGYRRQIVAVAECGAARRTDHWTFHVGQQVIGRYLGRRVLLRFHGPLLSRGTDLPKIIDANILLRRAPSSKEVGDGNRCQESDDCYHNHYFQQRESVLPLHPIFHKLVPLSLRAFPDFPVWLFYNRSWSTALTMHESIRFNNWGCLWK